MKYISALSLVASLAWALPMHKRESGCVFEGLGQIEDGQVRCGEGNVNDLKGSFNDGHVTDSKGRTCYITDHHQFQCSSPPSNMVWDDMFGIDSAGYFTHMGKNDWWLCPTGQGSKNVYTTCIDSSCTSTQLKISGCGEEPSSTCDTAGKPTVYPNLIVPVSSQEPDKAFGTQYIGEVDGSVGKSLVLQFDIPGDIGGTCLLKGMFPDKSQLQTSDYTLTNADIWVDDLSADISTSTTYSSLPSKGDSYGELQLTDQSWPMTGTFNCNAGYRKNILLTCKTDDCYAKFFEDYNPPPVGFVIVGGC